MCSAEAFWAYNSAYESSPLILKALRVFLTSDYRRGGLQIESIHVYSLFFYSLQIAYMSIKMSQFSTQRCGMPFQCLQTPHKRNYRVKRPQ